MIGGQASTIIVNDHGSSASQATVKLPPQRVTTFRGDLLRLLSGTGIAQVLALVAAPLLTRLYPPEAFGVAALFASIAGIVCVLACLRYELAIVLPESDREAANLLAVSIVISFGVSILMIPIIWIGGERIAEWAGTPQLGVYLWLLPMMILSFGMFTALNYWNTRTRQFTRLSIARVANSLTSTCGSIGGGVLGPATGGNLIAASVGGQMVASFVLARQIWNEHGRFLAHSITRHDMKAELLRHRQFPVYNSGSALMNTVSLQLPPLLLAAYFSPVTVGFYALGHRLLNLPMALLGGSIGQVFYQRASRAATDGTLPELVLGTVRRLLVIAAFPFLALTVVGPDLFTLVFGAEWVTAGHFLQILSPLLFFVFLSSPISTLISVLGAHKVGLSFNLALLMTRCVSLVVGGIYGDVFVALWLYSLSGMILRAWFTAYLTARSGISIRRLFLETLPALLLGPVFVLFILACDWVFAPHPVWIMVAAAVAACGYYGTLLPSLMASKVRRSVV